LVEEKFGPLPTGVQQRVGAFSMDRLRQLRSDFLKAHSLADLHLEE
jgi:hypothetical protein